MIELILMPMLAGIGLAIASGPLGAFVVWRRMAYFGDTLAHSALLGVGLSLAFELHTSLGIAIVCCFSALILSASEKFSLISTDSLLGILSHSTLALGIVILGLLSTRVDIGSYLFGDILTVTPVEVTVITSICLVCLCLILFFWRALITMLVDQELAQVEGCHVGKLKLLIVLLLAMIISVSIKIVGVLLITALLIIPAASARKLSSSPEAMAIAASIVGVLSVITGLLGSMFFDSPAGPSIVLSSALFFILITLFTNLKLLEK